MSEANFEQRVLSQDPNEKASLKRDITSILQSGDLALADYQLNVVTLAIDGAYPEVSKLEKYRLIAQVLPSFVLEVEQIVCQEAMKSNDLDEVRLGRDVLSIRYLRSILVAVGSFLGEDDDQNQRILDLAFDEFIKRSINVTPGKNFAGQLNRQIKGEVSQSLKRSAAESLPVANFSDLEADPTREVSIPNPYARVERYLAVLNPREREVIEARFGFNSNEETLRETGKLIGKVTPERVRQIETKALKKLREVGLRERWAMKADLAVTSDKRTKFEQYSDPKIDENLQLGLKSAGFTKSLNKIRDGVISGKTELERFSVAVLNLSPHALGALIEAELTTVGQLTELTPEMIRELAKMGEISLREVIQKLSYAHDQVEYYYKLKPREERKTNPIQQNRETRTSQERTYAKPPSQQNTRPSNPRPRVEEHKIDFFGIIRQFLKSILRR